MSAASQLFDAAMVEMQYRDIRTPCQHSNAGLWTSEIAADRGLAVPLCSPCPLLALCADFAAEFATFGVYGGRDMTPTTKRVAA